MSAQNHDQIGNRARGDRITEALTESQLLCAALLLYAGPSTPMLFMGEEWAASTPFQFFTSHPEPELGRLTAEGRLAEFARMGWDESVVPDPQDPATFERSKLDWSELRRDRHARVLDGYRQLATLRRELPALTDPRWTRNRVEAFEEAGVLRLLRGVPEAAAGGDGERAGAGEGGADGAGAIVGRPRHETEARQASAEIVINFGDRPQSFPVTHQRIRFRTHPDVAFSGELSLPPGSGALLT